MAVLELYGKCKELGRCDCGGFFGCSKPDKFAANEPLVAMVECTVCERSHAPNHPHIANIDGDIPIDDESPQPAAVDRALPAWLKDKPGAHVIRPASDTETPRENCQVCGKPWAPKHECLAAGASAPGKFNGYIGAPQSHRAENLCEVCGRVKRSNHNCKGAPGSEKPCMYCTRAGAPCVRHGGERSSVRAAVPDPPDERVATALPMPTAITQPTTPPVSAAKPELDRELAAILTILGALDGLTAEAMKRALEYVADRKGTKQETQS